jgi:2-dehydro-3-deoxy-D-arabinonate dehydratase
LQLVRDKRINDIRFLNELSLSIQSITPYPFSASRLEKGEQDFPIRLLLPFSPPEVWAVGVTYKKTAELHEEDVKASQGAKGIYDYVFRSERPEIFFKALPQHCVGPLEPLGIRSDSSGTIVEAELAFVYDRDGQIVAYTAANDVTAWDIETECPLFLTQAKMFIGSCALGPGIVPAVHVPAPDDLAVGCEVTRDGHVIFLGEGNTRNRKRSAEDLTRYLLLNNSISDGTVLCTGTAVGVPSTQTIHNGDVVTISIDEIGILRNQAHKLT